MVQGRTFGKLQRLCATIVGLVFLLAGIFKIFDPVGAGLVLEEYFRLVHLDFLLPVAKPLAVAVALFESLLGAALISGIRRVAVAFVTTVLLGFFTLLTLALAIFNPDIDCGCFGEVVHLTHLQSLLKNVVLMALSLSLPSTRTGISVPTRSARIFPSALPPSCLQVSWSIHG